VLEQTEMRLRIANTGTEAIELALTWRPDVALVDIGLPDMSGIELGQRLLEIAPNLTLLAVTALTAQDTVRKALKTGFRGFLPKSMPLQELVTSIDTALRGLTVLPQHPSARPVAPMTDEERHAALLIRQLTTRELEVLALLARGAHSQQIEDNLGVSRNTVRTHVQNILTKLQVHSRLEAVAFVVRHGVIKASSSARRLN